MNAKQFDDVAARFKLSWLAPRIDADCRAIYTASLVAWPKREADRETFLSACRAVAEGMARPGTVMQNLAVEEDLAGRFVKMTVEFVEAGPEPVVPKSNPFYPLDRIG